MTVDPECLRKCIVSDVSCLELCFKSSGWTAPTSSGFALPNYAAILVAGLLLCFSALFSGLNLGLLSLDLVALRIYKTAGTEKERVQATKIEPVRKYGNLLLCTILFGNTVVNSGISILLADLTTGTAGLFISTLVILLLGEIIPQAVCSRNALLVGSYAIPLIKVFLVVFFPVAYPISKALDFFLGRELGNIYSQEELKKLIDIHANDPDAQKESCLTEADHRLLMGVFEYKDKRVRDVMTQLEDCLMLERSTKLDFPVMSKIYISGCSRIPVYETTRQQVVGILYVKDLILVDPEDEMELSSVMAFRGFHVSRIYEDVTLDQVLTNFLTSANHLLIAHRRHNDNGHLGQEDITASPVTGLITLEDVIEEMIKGEIYDETDKEAISLRRQRGHREDVDTFLHLFDHKNREMKLTKEEVAAAAAFLARNVPEFEILSGSEVVLKGLLRTAEVLDKRRKGSSTGGDLLWEEDDEVQRGEVLYCQGEPTPCFVLVLQGKVLVRTGAEGFQLELGPWSVLATKALTMDSYIPDFDAVGIPPYRLVRIRRAAFLAAVEASCVDHKPRTQVRDPTLSDSPAEPFLAGNVSDPVVPNRHSAHNWPSTETRGPGSSRLAVDHPPPHEGRVIIEMPERLNDR